MLSYNNEIQEDQRSSHSARFLAPLVFAFSTAMPPYLVNASMDGAFSAEGNIAALVCEQRNVAERIIQRIIRLSEDEAMRDEDEEAPPQKVVDEMIRLIRSVVEALPEMPYAQVSSFYGELSATWRDGDRIVRLATFPNRPSLLQTGSIMMPVGSFSTKSNPDPKRIAQEISLAQNEHDPEGQLFPG